MRLLVYGAGVLGCELAHALMQNKKNDVTLLARGEWKERIDQKGLVIRQWVQLKTTVDRVRTIEALAPDDCYDMIFVVVQANQRGEILPILRQNSSRYIVFVGNDPHARSTMTAMQRPVDKIAFGFLQAAGHREHDRVVSVHAGLSMTIGGATTKLSSAFRQRLAASFHGTKCRLELYGDMDEWLKCHAAIILPICYVCYAVGGDLSKTTKEQRRDVISAAFECCLMLKAAGVPVNDKENTDYYREGTKQFGYMEKMLLLFAKTPLGRLCASDHAMHAVKELRYIDEGMAEIRAKTQSPMPTWDKLRSAMPSWDELEELTGNG